MTAKKPKLKKTPNKNIIHLKVLKANGIPQTVSRGTVSIRLFYISEYIHFLARVKILELKPLSPLKIELEKTSQELKAFIRAKSPKNKWHAKVREGLSKKELEKLKKVISPSSVENPWPSEAVRYRNELIVEILLSTGIRRGELLNIKVEDINFYSSTIQILRRPNDPSDTRRYQPLVKTRSSEIHISNLLCEKIKQYIFAYRAKEEGSRKHGFLLVSDRGGEALSLKSVNAMFEALRNKVSVLRNLCKTP